MWVHWDGATQTTFSGANQYARVFEVASGASAFAYGLALATSASSQLMVYCSKGINVQSANLGVAYSSISAQWLMVGCGIQNSGATSAIVTSFINGTTSGPTTAVCSTLGLTSCSSNAFATARVADASGTGVATPGGLTERQFSEAVRGVHLISATTLTAANFNSMLNGGAKVGSDVFQLSMDEGTGDPTKTAGSATVTISDGGTANDPVWSPHPRDPQAFQV
jgi:hypothetical protein